MLEIFSENPHGCVIFKTGKVLFIQFDIPKYSGFARGRIKNLTRENPVPSLTLTQKKLKMCILNLLGTR